MMSSVTSEQYEVMYTMRSEMFAKKDGQDPQCYGPPRGFAPWGIGPRGFGRAPWMDVTPAERDVFVKYRQKVGGAIGARTSMSTSNIRTELFTELLQLPGDKAPHSAQAREILQTKLAHNAYAQELLKGAGLPTASSSQDKPATDSFKDK
ncbi:hypothetical protein JG688_00008568 [Phytophthora aleatoria]|uniref:Uncharacterized protein n=1 Tax=Phytophthora aleatoria TaxID=2496075 RepID=A0A8J5J4N1_9STRA|nr:hypothetical protein JG688_00008568 [Phytophthora aleatoria]